MFNTISADNKIVNLSHKFGVVIVKYCMALNMAKKCYALSDQLLRAGTSIGANIREAQRAQSYPDFISKMNISLKEADETCYWLEIMHEAGVISNNNFNILYPKAIELLKILKSIVKTSRNNYYVKETDNFINPLQAKE